MPSDPARRSWLLMPVVAFVLLRVMLLVVGLVVAPDRADEDIRLYANWGRELYLSLADGQNFYDRTPMEYPPPVMLVLLPPAAAAAALGDPASLPLYRGAFRVMVAGFDLLAFLGLIRLLPRLFPTSECGERLSGYVVAAALTGTTFLHRLDLLVGLLVLAAVGLTARGRWGWGFAALAAGIGFKIVPACVAPLFLLASLPGLPPAAGWGRTFGRLVGRGLLLTALTAATVAPFVAAYGARALDFVGYHRDRGLEVGSTYASALFLREHVGGGPNEYRPGFGSLEVFAVGSDQLRAVSGVVTVGLVATAAVALLLRWRRFGEPTGPPLAVRDPGGFAAASVLALLGFMAGNKVFSPQYLLWVVPLLPLIGFDPRRRRAVQLAALALCALTTAAYMRGTEVTLWRPTVTATGEVVCLGPDAVTGGLLLARNVGVVVLFGVLARWLAVAPPPVAR